MWEHDPAEYIRKGYDVMEDMHTERTAAANFVTEVADHRAKDQLGNLVGRKKINQ